MTEELPDRLDQDRNVLLRGRERAVHGRRVVIAVLGAVVVLALANAFGQEATTSRAGDARAQLEVRVAPRLRGGLFFQGKIVVTAHSSIEHPVIELGKGWSEEIQANTVAPDPESSTSSKDTLSLDYGPLRAGETLTVWMQFEANPTGAGRRDQSVRLLDGEEPLAVVTRRVTVFP